jgi:hypothetical protein
MYELKFLNGSYFLAEKYFTSNLHFILTKEKRKYLSITFFDIVRAQEYWCAGKDQIWIQVLIHQYRLYLYISWTILKFPGANYTKCVNICAINPIWIASQLLEAYIDPLSFYFFLVINSMGVINMVLGQQLPNNWCGHIIN